MPSLSVLPYNYGLSTVGNLRLEVLKSGYQTILLSPGNAHQMMDSL